MYQFRPGTEVGIFDAGELETVAVVVRQHDGVVLLDDGSTWYAASGRPTGGRGTRRLSLLTDAVVKQIRVRGKIRRLVEAVVMLGEASESLRSIPEPLVDRALAVVEDVLRTRAMSLKNPEAALRAMRARLDAAASRAFDDVRRKARIWGDP